MEIPIGIPLGIPTGIPTGIPMGIPMGIPIGVPMGITIRGSHGILIDSLCFFASFWPRRCPIGSIALVVAMPQMGMSRPDSATCLDCFMFFSSPSRLIWFRYLFFSL